MAIDKIVKANDGRGQGHIGRVRNWISFSTFKSFIEIIANREYADLVPEEVQNVLVKDEGWRVNLDEFIIYEKFSPRNRTRGISREEGVAKYYFSLANSLTSSPDIKLVYIDDQNSPETLFLGGISKLIGIPCQDIMTLAPDAKIAFEIETQIWDRNGNGGIGKTREECFREADYLHLSTNAEFLRNAIDLYDFTSDNNNKVIPMGFPLADSSRKIIDTITSNPSERQRVINELYSKFGEPNQSKRLVYSSFGAGEGADKVVDSLCGICNEFDNVIFVAGNPRDNLAQFAIKKGYEVIDITTGVKKIVLDNNKGIYLTNFGSIDSHLELVAGADVLVQGNGSGTTYEGIKSQNPIINIPLARPGYEQLIKGLGVKACGGGELLLLNDVALQLKELEKLTASYGYNLQNGGLSLTTNNLKLCLEKTLSNPDYYKDNLKDMQRYFADPEVIAKSVEYMADGIPAQHIIQLCSLTPYR